MAGFQDTISPVEGDAAGLGLSWLAGLLEAEGTFLKPPPSAPAYPIVSCRMTDRDVVERVAGMFGSSVVVIDKGRYRTEYAAMLKGSRAVALMRDLLPLMGMRRRAAIEQALEGYAPPRRKLSFEAAEEIRRRHAEEESVSSLSRRFGVARSTIRLVLQRRIYREQEAARWRGPISYLPGTTSPPIDLSPTELCWLAGWLEGEGSFCPPPPSDPRRPRITAQGSDHDVLAEVARLMKVTARLDRSHRARKRGWSPTWRVLRRGCPAVALMQAMQPLMGARRRKQIRRALEAARRAGSPAFETAQLSFLARGRTRFDVESFVSMLRVEDSGLAS